MRIKSLNRNYVQKSRIFLYPLLGIKRGVSVTPMETYMSWEGKYEVEDCRLTCLYRLRDDRDFKVIESTKLTGNPLFDAFFEIEGDIGAYVFDLSDHKQDFLNVVNGKYSQLSDKHKQTVMNFFKSHSSHHVYIESYLNPKKFIPMYADMLSTESKDVPSMRKLLMEVGELCSMPDHDKERLTECQKIMNIQTLSLNSPQ